MNLDEIKRLIEFIKAQELSEFELEQDGVKIRIKSGAGAQPVPVIQALPLIAAPVPHGAPVAPGAPAYRTEPVAPVAPDAPEEGSELAIVKSPILGTFYRAAEPGAANLVEVGDTVTKGQLLCIIEAMKLMNKIDSEYDGEIVSIYVENERPVQYGERLFAIKLRA